MSGDDEPLEDEDTGPIRLWPALLALGVMAVLAVIVAAAALSSNEEDEPDAGPEMTMRIVLAAPASGGAVRLVTVTNGCELPTRATADLRADAVAFTVYGQNAGGGCTAESDKLACRQVVLPQAVGPRRVVPEPDPRAPGAGRGARRGGPVPADDGRVLGLVGHEVDLAGAADGAVPVRRDVLERGPGRDAPVGIALGGVVDEPAGLADPQLRGFGAHGPPA